MRKIKSLVMVIAVLGLGACDRLNNDLERGAVGAAIGCAVGEVFVNGKCVEGAIIGGAAGVVSDDL